MRAAIDVAKPFTWTSRFGSLTFNQYGREFPSGGINEKGLVVELMWLDDTRYPAPDGRGELPTLQWIQYQLDTAANVDDANSFADNDAEVKRNLRRAAQWKQTLAFGLSYAMF